MTRYAISHFISEVVIAYAYQSKVAQLQNMEETVGFKLLCMQFLNKLPRSLGVITHGLKGKIENNSQADNSELWNTVYVFMVIIQHN